jgi:septum formation protein
VQNLPDGVQLVLASKSPRRAELLTAAGFEFQTIVAEIDESRRAGETPSTYVRRLAAEKSAAAVGHVQHLPSTRDLEATRDDHQATPDDHQATRNDDLLLLGADTAVIVDGEILGKPHDDREAEAMLRRLSGRQHEVMTGISLRRVVFAGGSKRIFRTSFELGRVETTTVFFNNLSEEDLRWYLASGEGRDKAGAYAIQGFGSRFIPRIDGSYSNVVGLPVATVVELMTELYAGQ